MDVGPGRHYSVLMFMLPFANSAHCTCCTCYCDACLQVPGSNAEVYPWILALGGTGIVVGLATYGYNSECAAHCMLKRHEL
jgi:phosphate/sulfate permease